VPSNHSKIDATIICSFIRIRLIIPVSLRIPRIGNILKDFVLFLASQFNGAHSPQKSDAKCQNFVLIR
jgi:hypothetical protein